MFDPWIQCDDLDLGAILHQANTVVSSASSSSGSSLSSHSSSLSSSCSPSSASPGSSKSPSCANSPRSLHQPTVIAAGGSESHPVLTNRLDQVDSHADQAQQVGFFCPQQADESVQLQSQNVQPDDKRNLFNVISGTTNVFHSNQLHQRPAGQVLAGKTYQTDSQQSPSNSSPGQLVSSVVQQAPGALSVQEHERNLLVGQQHVITSGCGLQDPQLSGQLYQSNQVQQRDCQENSANQAQEHLQHLQQAHQHQQRQNQHQSARPTQVQTAQKTRRCRHITDYVLAEEEKRLLIKEGYTDFPMICQARPLSKTEERILRKIRRKIRNKKSAQCSRQRKKEYVEDLERKYAAVVRENGELKEILERVQQQQHQQQQHQSQQQPQQHSNISLYRSICLQ